MEPNVKLEDMKKSLEELQVVVIRLLKVGDVLPYLIESDLPREFATKLRKKARLETDMSAAQDLVDYILRDGQSRMITSFFHSLKEAEYEHLLNLLEQPNMDPTSKDIFVKLLDCYCSSLLIIDPVAVAPHLVAKNVLSQTDLQEIQADQRNYGDHYAVMTLLQNVHRRSPDWFGHFMGVLWDLEYIELIEKIVPEIKSAGSEESILYITRTMEKLHTDASHSTAYKSDPKKEAELKEELDLPVPRGSEVAEHQLHYVSVGAAAEQPLEGQPDALAHAREPPEGANAVDETSCQNVDPGETLPKQRYRPLGPDSHHVSGEAGSFSLHLGSGTHASGTTPMNDINMNNSGETQVKQYTKDVKKLPDKYDSLNIDGLLSSSENGDSLGSSTPEFDESIKVDNTGPGQQDTRSEFKGVESLATGSSFDGSQTEDPVEELKLRDYQMELAEEALQGKNVLVAAPTGSGKTHVALYISKEHLEMGVNKHRVVFLVPTVALVDQQCNQYQRYLQGFKCIAISGDIQAAAKVPLGSLIPQYDVMVMTPQILVDALQKKEMESISQFTLMIFDECHHTNKGHPYNTIMAHYLEDKLSDDRKRQNNLPQVIGLTASVGVGKARNEDGAVEHILQLCANLDSQALSSVTNNKQELEKHVNSPKQESVEVRGRLEDPFRSVVERLMLEIENKMKTSPEARNVKEISDFEQLLTPPSERGEQRYTQWVSMVRRKVACIYIQQQRRLFMACIRHLMIYNDAMMINADCRIKDAVEYIKKQFSEQRQDYFDETDKWLESIFKEKEEYLKRVSCDPRYKNPKLQTLKKMIQKKAKNMPDLRGIIFCKTRDMTLALQNWMQETEELKWLNPKRLTGSNATADKAGTTQVQQVDILKFFKEGSHKIIIATTVAEEGLDIQKCNLVIRYELVTNEIAMVQARGRGRAKDAQYILVAETGRGTAEKEEFNKIREGMMMRAMVKIQHMPRLEFTRSVYAHQKKAHLERRMAEFDKKAKEMQQRKRGRQDALFELRCIKCDSLGCLSDQIRKVVDVHHFVIDREFRKRIKVEPHPKPTNLDPATGIFMTGKIFCGKCHGEWGIMAIYRKAPFPVVKIDCFVLVDDREKRTVCKKWKDSPFYVADLTIEDMQENLREIERDEDLSE